MTVRPIMFSAPMVQALLAGRKTQTRRVLTLRGYQGMTEFGASTTQGFDWHFRRKDMAWVDLTASELRASLPYQVGDRLYVRETWRTNYGHDYFDDDLGRCPRPSDLNPKDAMIEYLADGERELGGKTRVAIHMPRWASRLTLIVTDVRVQRVQSISPADALAEGIPRAANSQSIDCETPDPRTEFSELWNSLHAEPPKRWEDNPWVVAVSFDVVRGNIDELAEAAS